MKILAIESSAAAASAAITENGRLVGEAYANVRLTHSRTLLPMVQNVLEQTETGLSSIDCFAVSCGPGSFTGVRIGVAAAKGLADGAGKPCMPVSALEAIAYPCFSLPCAVCAVMDARCGQVYTAAFRDGARLTEDEALRFGELRDRLMSLGRAVLAGDGAELCFERFSGECENLVLAGPLFRFQRAASVGLLAEKLLLSGKTPVSAAALLPKYLRLPQAERDLNKVEKGERKR